MKPKIRLTSGGGYPASSSSISRPERWHQLRIGNGPVIARGCGHSYGDAALNKDGEVILMERLNRFISFDARTGLVSAEAGVTLAEVIATFAPRGWFVPVVPHTKYCTLGGCVALDAHGSNHIAAGSFSKWVREIELMVADGTRHRCSPVFNAEVFWATMGGLGLTGIITEVTLQLAPFTSAYISVSRQTAHTLDALLEKLYDSASTEPYVSAWIDCSQVGPALGRGVVTSAHSVAADDLPPSITRPYIRPRSQRYSLPCLPGWVINPWTTQALNALYFGRHKGHHTRALINYDSFFFPLDRFKKWNRLYGKRGFIHYACVIPTEHAREGMLALVQELVSSKKVSSLAKVQRLGPQGEGPLSFPMEGVSLSCHLPFGDGDAFSLLDRLDALVILHGGRVQLGNDCRLRPEMFHAMYPRFSQWQAVKSVVDPEGTFCSDLSRRVMSPVETLAQSIP